MYEFVCHSDLHRDPTAHFLCKTKFSSIFSIIKSSTIGQKRCYHRKVPKQMNSSLDTNCKSYILHLLYFFFFFLEKIKKNSNKVFHFCLGSQSLSPSFHHRVQEEGIVVLQNHGSGPLPVQPYPAEEVLRPSLTRGVSVSLPSSPLLPPRQPYLSPVRSNKSPGAYESHFFTMKYHLTNFR